MFGNKISKIIFIEGMSCEHCSKRIEKALKSIKGVNSVSISLEKKNAKIILKSDIDNLIIKEAVENLGFEVANIENL